jgi:hypothetical protein
LSTDAVHEGANENDESLDLTEWPPLGRMDPMRIENIIDPPLPPCIEFGAYKPPRFPIPCRKEKKKRKEIEKEY